MRADVIALEKDRDTLAEMVRRLGVGEAYAKADPAALRLELVRTTEALAAALLKCEQLEIKLSSRLAPM